MAKKRKKIGSMIFTVLLAVAMLAGVSLLLYPTVANWWNRQRQTRVISQYRDVAGNLSRDEYDKVIRDAEEYNRLWAERGVQRLRLTEAERTTYRSFLSTQTSDTMGWIDIPILSVQLPIYHGTDDAVLQKGIGHLEWSALPVGGEGTHCVLSGHSALPSARLFTDLGKMIVGDTFVIHVLDEIYTYEVDRINIVLPEETSDLMPEAGEDYCTLITCTPYAVNTHRLLVRGHRIDNAAAERIVRIEANAVQVSTLAVALFIGVPVIVILFFGVLIFTGSGNRKKRRKKQYAQHEISDQNLADNSAVSGAPSFPDPDGDGGAH